MHTFLRPIPAAFAGLLLILLTVGCGKKKTEEELPGPLGAPDFTLTAVDFAAEFDQNKREAAVAKYEGKVVELSGTVQMASRDDGETQGLIGFASGEKDKFFPVCTCLFPDRNIAAILGKNQTVRLKGRFVRHFVLPVLDRCEILEKGPDTLVHVTAEQLAKEYTSDEDACEAKYDKKSLLVTGVIAAVKTDENKVKFVELQGDGKTVIEIRYIAWTGKWPVEYKPGDRARLTGEMLKLGNGRNKLVVVMDVALDS